MDLIEHTYDTFMVMSGDVAEAEIGSPAPDPDVLIAEIAGRLNVQNGRLVAVMADVLSNDDCVGTGVHSPTGPLAIPDASPA